MAELRAVVIEVNISTWSTVSITKHWSKKKDTHIGIASDPLLVQDRTVLGKFSTDAVWLYSVHPATESHLAGQTVVARR